MAHQHICVARGEGRALAPKGTMWRRGVLRNTVIVCRATGINRNANTICEHTGRSVSRVHVRVDRLEFCASCGRTLVTASNDLNGHGAAFKATAGV